jgi:divalent metal cation (Fe/Co/Zn/Cd) transporter
MDLTDIISPELVKQARQIITNTEGVIDLGPILMRRSGDTIFADITISLRADVSFDIAHEISNNVETNVKNKIPNAAITIHFEPNWKGVPRNSKVNDIVSSIDGVKEVHNISSYSSAGKVYLSLHVMVDQKINLDSAHKISEIIEEKIQREIPETEHVTIHLEPFVAIPENLKVESKKTGEQINKLLNEYEEIKKIGRIVTLNFKDVLKIDIDISFEKNLSIKQVHDLTSQIEQKIRNEFKNSVITIHPEPI